MYRKTKFWPVTQDSNINLMTSMGLWFATYYRISSSSMMRRKPKKMKLIAILEVRLRACKTRLKRWTRFRLMQTWAPPKSIICPGKALAYLLAQASCLIIIQLPMKQTIHRKLILPSKSTLEITCQMQNRPTRCQGLRIVRAVAVTWIREM